LTFASRLNTNTDSCRGFSLPLVSQLLVVDAGNLDVDVDAVEQRAADALLVAGDGGGRTATLFDGVAVEATRAPMQLAVVTNSSISVTHSLRSHNDIDGILQEKTLKMRWRGDFKRRGAYSQVGKTNNC
jgi:hypothetical protein